jgi:hypothetical protein
MRSAGAMVGSSWEPGFLCNGIAIGTDAYMRHKLEEKREEVTEVGKAVKGVLGPQKDRQEMWTLLRWCICLSHLASWRRW